MNDQEQSGDQVQLDNGFEIKCLNCGSTNCEIVDGRAMGSSWTGPYGSMDIICNDCKQTELVRDT